MKTELAKNRRALFSRVMPRSLRAQFAVALSAMGLLVCAGGATAVYALRATSEAAREVSQQRLARMEAAQELLHRTQQIQLLADRMISAISSDAARGNYVQILHEIAAMEQLTARLAVTDDASVLDLHEASQLFRASAHVVAQAREASSPQGGSAAVGLYRDQMQAHAQAMARSARLQSQHLTLAYQDAVQRLVDTSRTRTYWVIGWLGLSLLGAFLTARALLGRHVMGRLLAVSHSLRVGDADTSHGPPRVPVYGDDEIGSMARALEQFLHDRSQLAQTRARLEQEQQRLAAIIDNTADSIVVLHDGSVVQMNLAAGRMFGIPQAQAVGLRIDVLMPGFDWQEPTMPGGTCDALARRGDGRTIPVEVSLNVVTAGAGDFVVLVIRDATMHREAERHLIAARDAALSARDAQAAFLATMSHELRTPLNAVLGYAQILRLEKSLTDRQTLAVDTIRRSGEHLLALINDLLDLGKHEAGKLDLYLSDVQLHECLKITCDIVRVKAEEAGLDFVVDVAPDVPDNVLADEKRLRQVLLNLLGNAVKFTERGSVTLHVQRIRCDNQLATLRFEVRDTGVGIRQNEHERIFLPFEQAGDSKRRSLGSGLGLAISRELVRLMGGDIAVSSQPGQGSKFSFELDLIVLQDDGTPPVLAQAAVVGYEGPRKRILVVDDVWANRRVLRDMLCPLGFEVHEAGDGRQALDVVRTVRPDVVVMDLDMPVMGGTQAIALMRRMAPMRSVPIIAVSSTYDANAVRLGAGTGADAFLSKPLERDRLLREIARHADLHWVAGPTPSERVAG